MNFDTTNNCELHSTQYTAIFKTVKVTVYREFLAVKTDLNRNYAKSALKQKKCAKVTITKSNTQSIVHSSQQNIHNYTLKTHMHDTHYTDKYTDKYTHL